MMSKYRKTWVMIAVYEPLSAIKSELVTIYSNVFICVFVDF